MHTRAIPLRHDVQPGMRLRLTLSFCGALTLHAGALALLSDWSAKRPDAPGEQMVAIDLAPQMIDAPSVESIETATPVGAPVEAPAVEVEDVQPAPAPSETSSQAALADAVRPPSAEPVEEAMSEISESDPRLTVATIAPPSAPEVITTSEVGTEESVVAELAPPELAVEPPPPEVQARTYVPPPERVKKEFRKPQPKPVARRAQPRPGAEGRDQRESARGRSSRENAGGAAASNYDPGALSRYSAQLAAALRGRLRYPDAARAAGATGVASVRFTIHRSGRVLSANIVRSAGHPALDQAAIATVAPGSSLPAAPAALTQQTFTISVPLRFNIR